MFPSSSGFSPFFQPPLTACTSQNPISQLQKQQADHSSTFLHFPGGFPEESYDFLENEHFPSQQQHQQEVFGTNLSADSPQTQEITPVDCQPGFTRRTRAVKNKNKKVSSNVEKPYTSQRRSRKKDRHSKICTAQGFRDRRMRLSLQIAREFFDLQDMLKFDKASKTIEWLIRKSNAAIKDLKETISKKSKQYSSGDGEAGGGKSASSTSESEVVSEIELQPQYEPVFSSPAVKKSRKVKKALVYNPLARCFREKARERARERTREKLKTTNPNPEQLVVSGSQEMNCAARGTENGEDQGKEPSTYTLQRCMDSLGITVSDRFVGIGDGQNFCVSNGANFENEYSGFSGTWEMNNEKAQYLLNGMPNIMSSSGNVHEQNPNAIFLTNPPNHHHHEQNFISSAFMPTMNYQQGNPNAVFVDISKTNTSYQENPTSITVNTARSNNFQPHHFVGNQLTSTITATIIDDVVNKYGSLY